MVIIEIKAYVLYYPNTLLRVTNLKETHLDICLTSDNQYLIDAIDETLPIITYAKSKTKEQKITDSNIANIDTKSFESPIGGITNLASNLYAMLPNFAEGTKEYNEIKKRIKLLRRFQGDAMNICRTIQ